MVEHESERGRVEAGVERIEHRAAHRYAVVAFEHRRRVGEHDCDRVAADESRASPMRTRASSTGREIRGSCAAGVRARSRACPETPPPRARGRPAASAAENWRRCGRDRDRRTTGTSGSSRCKAGEARARPALRAMILFRPGFGRGFRAHSTKGEGAEADKGQDHCCADPGGDKQGQDSRRHVEPEAWGQEHAGRIDRVIDCEPGRGDRDIANKGPQPGAPGNGGR